MFRTQADLEDDDDYSRKELLEEDDYSGDSGRSEVEVEHSMAIRQARLAGWSELKPCLLDSDGHSEGSG